MSGGDATGRYLASFTALDAGTPRVEFDGRSVITVAAQVDHSISEVDRRLGCGGVAGWAWESDPSVKVRFS